MPVAIAPEIHTETLPATPAGDAMPLFHVPQNEAEYHAAIADVLCMPDTEEAAALTELLLEIGDARGYELDIDDSHYW